MKILDDFFASAAHQYFPQPTPEDLALLAELPEEFRLSVPYVAQTSRSGSGSACLKMLADFHGVDATAEIARLKKMESSAWKHFNHETLKEDLNRAGLRAGLLPFNYYPGRFVLPKFKEGHLGADFIASNMELFSAFDHLLLKASIFGTKAPATVRIHFATDEYEMPEEMACVLDTAGQGLVVCGWNKEGFLVHDPWNSEKWGGYGGGAYRQLSYKRLSQMKPFVNCCLDDFEPWPWLTGIIRGWENAVYENREMMVHFELESPRLPSYFFGYVTWDYACSLSTSKNIKVLSAPGPLPYAKMAAASKNVFSWRINTGPNPGSFPIDVTVRAEGTYPVFQWETAPRTPLKFQASRLFKARLDVKRLSWLNKYGRV